MVPHGGWLPVVISLFLFTVITTWRTGSSLLSDQITHMTLKVQTFIGRVAAQGLPRIPGTAVFFTGRLEQTPPAAGTSIRVLEEHGLTVIAAQCREWKCHVCAALLSNGVFYTWHP